MTNKLRKVRFSYGEADGFIPNLTEEQIVEEEERTKKRDGLFHCWIDVEEESSKSGHYREKTMALVEDLENGKIHYVEPELIEFVMNNYLE